METRADVARNADSFLQIGDLVAGSFFLSSATLLLLTIFLFFKIFDAPRRWRTLAIIVNLVPFIACINSFYRRSYWISTQTNPVEFRFFDWFLTVPLMVITFYYLLKPLGAKRGMAIRLFIAGIWMLAFGYLGEALYPEQSITWGILGSVGFAAIIGIILGEGYPKIFKPGVDPILRRGYLWLSILLPIGWTVYPIGYMAMPGNILEGFLDINTTAIMYNLADVFNKGGLALGVYYIVHNSKESLKRQIAIEKTNGYVIPREMEEKEGRVILTARKDQMQ